MLEITDVKRPTRKTCQLPQIDPWNPQLLKYLRPDWNPLKGCKVTRVMHTELKDGRLKTVGKL